MIVPIPKDMHAVTVVFAVVGGGEAKRRIAVKSDAVYQVHEIIGLALAKVKRLRIKHRLANCLRITCGKASLYDYQLDH